MLANRVFDPQLQVWREESVKTFGMADDRHRRCFNELRRGGFDQESRELCVREDQRVNAVRVASVSFDDMARGGTIGIVAVNLWRGICSKP